MANGRRRGKKIDFVHWTGFAVHSSGLSAGTAAATAIGAQHLPETLLRIRGEYTTSIDGAGAPGRFCTMATGLILVPEGTGTTVLWSPLTDADAPWIWYDFSVIGHEEMVADVIAVQNLLGFRRVIDNKAMRIVRNQEMQVVFENTTVQSACVTNTSVVGRMLAGK